MSGLIERERSAWSLNGLLVKPYTYQGTGTDTLTGHLTDDDLAPYRRDDEKPWLAPCGTEAAYRRHCRRSEEIDEACRQANQRKNDAYKARRQQRRQGAAS